MEYDLSVIIPVFNEQNNIESTLNKIIDYLNRKDLRFELILVNDGSKDDSFKIINEFKRLNSLSKDIVILNNIQNMGKGFSVQRGALNSKGEFVLFTDADLSTPIEEIDNMLKYLQDGYNIVIGSRGMKDSNIILKQNIIRQSMGKVFNHFVKMLLKLKYSDTQCGFKCFDKKTIELIFPALKIKDFSFDVEILYLADMYGLRTKELPINWKNSDDSKVSIIKDSIKMFISLTKIKKIHKGLVYHHRLLSK